MTLKWIQKKMSNLYCVMPLVLLIGFASFTSTPGGLTAFADYSEKDVFKSIFFADGDLAESIPELSQFNVRNFTKDAKAISNALQAQEEIYNTVNEQHPNYMASLKSAIASGNHLTIQRSIQEGGQYVNEIYSSMNPELDDATKNEMVANFSDQIDVKNASPEELRGAINDYINSGNNTNPMFKQACIAIVLLLLIALVLVVPVLVAGNPIEATLANEMIVNALANSVRR